MPFIGNQPALSYTSFAKQDFTTSATTSYTLDHPVTNENEIALFINFVRQEPTTAYTASGTSLTLTSATSASDDMYCVYLGKAVQTVNPPNGSVGASQISDGSIALGKLSATGTKDSTTFLRGDNTFASAGGANTPAFYARANNDQTISDNTITTVIFDNEDFDTNNAFASNTFTVPSGEAGKYFFTTNVNYINPNSSNYRILYIYKNTDRYIEFQRLTDDAGRNNFNLSTMMDLSVGDTVSVKIEQNSGSSMTINRIGSADKRGIHFGGYKIIE